MRKGSEKYEIRMRICLAAADPGLDYSFPGVLVALA
jgi:hypothetical protein